MAGDGGVLGRHRGISTVLTAQNLSDASGAALAVRGGWRHPRQRAAGRLHGADFGSSVTPAAGTGSCAPDCALNRSDRAWRALKRTMSTEQKAG